jgi:hypothetical protein
MILEYVSVTGRESSFINEFAETSIVAVLLCGELAFEEALDLS